MDYQYKHISFKKMSDAVGVELSGFDLSRPITDEVFAEIRRAFIDHYLIVIRDQNLTPESLCAFSKRFGPLTKTPYLIPKDGHPYVVSLTREANTDKSIPVIGERWHSDGAFMEETSLGSMLYALDVPPKGGNTHFASLQRAYDSLSTGMQELAERLFVMNYPTVFDPDRQNEAPNLWKGSLGYDKSETGDVPLREYAHPLVCFHPENGKKLLRLAGFFSIRFKDMTVEESKPLMSFFQERIVDPAHVCTVKWTKGTVVLWDNRAVQHRVDNDYQGYRREMWRTQIAGPRLEGPATKGMNIPRSERVSPVALA